jgi:hypothetical protein
MIRSSPNQPIADGTDWRFLDPLGPATVEHLRLPAASGRRRHEKTHPRRRGRGGRPQRRQMKALASRRARAAA